MSEPEAEFDDVVQGIDAGLEKLTKRLTKLPRESDEFRQVVARIARLTPEPGYSLLKNAAIGVHLVGADGTILWANECELETLGYEPSEYFGRSITELHMDADVIEHILTTLTEGGQPSAYPARLKSADGTPVYVLISSNVYRDNSFAHTRCFTMQVNEETYLARKCCNLTACPHKLD
jgi:PAS domain S-box-containing protein